MPEGLSRSGYGERTVSPCPPAGGLENAGANRQSPAAKSFLAYSPYYAKLYAALKVEKELPQP